MDYIQKFLGNQTGSYKLSGDSSLARRKQHIPSSVEMQNNKISLTAP
jgi:hypothetical protein